MSKLLSKPSNDPCQMILISGEETIRQSTSRWKETPLIGNDRSTVSSWVHIFDSDFRYQFVEGMHFL